MSPSLGPVVLLLAFLSITPSVGAAVKSASTGYTSFTAGSKADVPPPNGPVGGLVLMGGGSDVDAAFQWMCNRAGGGDFVVIRTTGTDAYNPYIKALCPQMDSVETIIITSTAGANATYVRDQIHHAEALWIAGGDQSTYTSLWRGTSVQTEVNYLLNTKQAPVGGTSAGLAVLSEFIYTGAAGSVTSSQALANPFHRYVTLEREVFTSPLRTNTIYDSHFVTRDRLGRLTVFLARIVDSGWSPSPRGIGIDEQTALLVEPSGSATGVGVGNAYFVQAPGPAQLLASKVPLTYQGIAVHRVAAGETFNVTTWTGSSGATYTLNVNNGVVTSTQPGGSIY